MKALCISIRGSFSLLTMALGLTGATHGYAARLAFWGDANAVVGTNLSALNQVTAVAGGGGFSLALNSDGTVSVLGQNKVRNRNVLILPTSLSNVVAVSAGSNHALALNSNGKVIAWGYGIFGETNVPVNLSNVVAVAAGSAHSLALRSDGTIVAWGSNSGNTLAVPSGLKDAKAIAAGFGSIALRQNGTVVVWGENSFGQLNVPAGLANVSAVAAGTYFYLALQSDGTVKAWGRNSDGESTVPPSATNVIAIAAGFAHALALRADGTMVAWGRNILGQTNIPASLTNVTSIAAGANHCLATTLSANAQILRQPQTLDVPYSSNATFSVIAIGDEPLAYRWFRNGIALNDGAAYVGATNRIFTVTNAQISHGGIYHVVVSNAFGAIRSSNATLTVISAPFITSQSMDQTVGAGAFAALSVTADGTPPLSYQWSLNGTELPGKTLRNLFLSAQPADSGTYSVVVRNDYGSASTSISLTVTNTAPSVAQPPEVRTTNGRTTITSPIPAGSSVLLSVSGRGSLPLSYQWRFNGVDIPNATNTTLALANLRYDQGGFYSVEIRNAFGTTNSAKVLLNVSQVLAFGAAFTDNANTPLGLSNVTAIAAGGSHILALTTDGMVKTWLANSAYIFGASRAVTNIPPNATNVIAISAGRDHCLALRSNGTVVAWGGNASRQTNVPAGLSNVVSVTAGIFRSFAVKWDGTVATWGASSNLPAGLSNVVSISDAGDPLVLKRDGTVLASLTNIAGLSNAIAIAGGNSVNLALKQDGSIYQSSTRVNFPTNISDAVAIANFFSIGALLGDENFISSDSFTPRGSSGLSNVIGIAIGGVTTDFRVALIGDGSPAITIQPVSQIVKKGDSIQLHSRAAGLQPVRYQWQLDGINLPGATHGSLIITNLQGKDTGAYRMVASNALGSVVSLPARISIPYSSTLSDALNATNLVWTTGTPTPGWFAQIQETHDNDAAAQSGAISHNQQSRLTATVVGPGTLSFWWKVSSEARYDSLGFGIDSTTLFLGSISGEVEWEQRTFSIPAGAHALYWIYSKDQTVSSGRDAGWVDEVVFTPLPVPPVFFRQPFNVTVLANATAVIPAAANGTPPLFYQWFKNGEIFPGATDPYLIITNVTRRDSATYQLRVSNAGGVSASKEVVLEVLVQQRFDPPVRLDDGSLLLFSRDADGGALLAEDLGGFEFQSSTNLRDWITISTAPGLTNGSLIWRDTNSLDSATRFYRAVEP